MEALAIQTEYSDELKRREQQARYDLETQFGELVDGNMRTSFELISDGQELYGFDGRSMGEITKNALVDAERIARKSPNLSFELRRRKLEQQEYADLLKMSAGELPNTMVVVSDFPEDLNDVKEDVGGYNVTRKQTMMRVLTRHSNGNIQMYSQSLDGSDRQALEAIYEHFGVKPEDGELLGQRINADLPSDEQDNLVDRLTGIYDRTLEAKYGGNWHAGRRPADYRNTYDFVCQQRDLIETCVQLHLDNQLDPKTMYNVAATMQQRFKAKVAPNASILRQPVADKRTIYREMELAGSQARRDGKSFSACGATLTGEGTEETEGNLQTAGYGNKVDEETNYKFDKWTFCVVCQAPPKENEPKKLCGPCGICRHCDTKIKKTA